jgi:Putative polyhydroxyalkanoic acid system protein (PHA_gran_rgn)
MQMSEPLVVSIPHRLGKDEAKRRLQAGLGSVRTHFAQLLAVQEETWDGNRLAFRVSALGQPANGTIDVQDDHVRLEVMLPWLLAKFAQAADKLIRRQGTLMLEKK